MRVEEIEIKNRQTLIKLFPREEIEKRDKIINFTTYKNKEREVSLFEVIWRTWGPYLYQYRTKKIDENFKRTVKRDTILTVIDALLHILADFPPMEKALAKLQEEGKIYFSGRYYEEKGKKWYHKPDFEIRSGAAALAKRKLVKYIVPVEDGAPDWQNIRWEMGTYSFREFHEILSNLLYKKIEENNAIPELKKAYEILEKLGEERGFRKNYSRLEK
jgi:hypothetical protein